MKLVAVKNESATKRKASNVNAAGNAANTERKKAKQELPTVYTHEVAHSYAKLRAMTTAEMDLRAHVLEFCQLNPGVARLALIDLLSSTASNADALKDQRVLKLLEANLKLAPAFKVQAMFHRRLATMVSSE
jgi:hypothetical protein